MTVTIEFSPDMEQQLQEAAARRGQAPADFVQEAVEEKLAAVAAATRIERNQRALELLDQWLMEPPDPDEEAGYPLEITPLSLREVSVE